jgi:predicted dienelactone hydrolase
MGNNKPNTEPTPMRVYEPARTPVPVRRYDALTLEDPVQDREVTVSAQVPEGPGPYPVIIFSHGSLCDTAAYESLTGCWAERGYIVLSPAHLDALTPDAAGPPPDLRMLLSSRVRDLSFIADSLDEIARLTDTEACIEDKTRLAAAGHSFGALTALIKTGVALRPDEYIYAGSPADDRFRVAVSISGVGPLPPLAEDAFTHLHIPMLVTGGTLDEGNVGAGPVFPWEWRMSAYALSPAGNKYSLALQDADHYFGGLLARHDRGGDADPVGLGIVAGISTAFLDAHLREQTDARDWLSNADISGLTDGRAAWEHK